MTKWSFDILRQSGWDLWVLVCVVAALVLATYALAGRLWQRRAGLAALPLIAVGVAGTAFIVALPALHKPLVGLFWTFALLSILSAVFYLNLAPQLGTLRTATLLVLRIAALAMLVPMLFEPILRYVIRPRPERPILFVIDSSGSMSVPDKQNGPNRLQSVWQALRAELPRLNEHFVPRYFTFDTALAELKAPDDLSRLSADGQSTDIVGGVSAALGKTTRQDAVVVVISDGIDNTTPDPGRALARTGRRINTVRVGSEQAVSATIPNVAIDNVEGPDELTVGRDALLKVLVKSSALANRLVDVKLSEVDDAGNPTGEVKSKSLVLQPLIEGQSVEIPFRPRTVGVRKLAAWVDPIPAERSTTDNRQDFQALAIDPRIKVLYVEGRVRPEYKPLRQALRDDQNVEAATLLRTRTDKFESGGTVDGEPFAVSGLPSGLDAWKKFDVLIVGDLDATYLTRAQQADLEKFVETGGGFIMIGGQNNFGPGGYKDTPIEKILPVFVGATTSPQEKTQFVPRLTPQGQTHPIMEGLTEWFSTAETRPSKELKPLNGNVVVDKPKAGAQVLLVHADRTGPDGQPQTVLAVHRFGEGRAAAFTADTTYLWSLPMASLGQAGPFKSYWGQVIRWLANTDVKNRKQGAGIDGLLNKTTYRMSDAIRIRALVRDEKGDVTPRAQVRYVLKKVGANTPRNDALKPVESRSGLYEAIIENPGVGQYVVELSAARQDGKPLGRQELKFSVIVPADEMLKIAAQPDTLRDIAVKTKGSAYDLEALPRLITELIPPQSNYRVQVTVPLANTVRTLIALTVEDPAWDPKYDLPMQAALVLSLLVAEWLLRRRWQLP